MVDKRDKDNGQNKVEWIKVWRVLSGFIMSLASVAVTVYKINNFGPPCILHPFFSLLSSFFFKFLWPRAEVPFIHTKSWSTSPSLRADSPHSLQRISSIRTPAPSHSLNSRRLARTPHGSRLTPRIRVFFSASPVTLLSVDDFSDKLCQRRE